MRLQRVAHLRPVERFRLLDRGGGERDRVPAATGPVRIAVAVLGAPQRQELADLLLERTVGKRVVDLGGRGDEEELVAQDLATGRNTARSSTLVSMSMSRPSCLMFLAAVSVVPPRPILSSGARAGRMHLLICTLRSASSVLYCSIADDLEAVARGRFLTPRSSAGWRTGTGRAARRSSSLACRFFR